MPFTYTQVQMHKFSAQWVPQPVHANAEEDDFVPMIAGVHAIQSAERGQAGVESASAAGGGGGGAQNDQVRDFFPEAFLFSIETLE